MTILKVSTKSELVFIDGTITMEEAKELARELRVELEIAEKSMKPNRMYDIRDISEIES